MKVYESSGKTIQEAISAGLEHLGVSISDVTIDILEEGSKGLFGLFGSRQAKVRFTLRDSEDVVEEILDAAPQKGGMSAEELARDAAEKPERKAPVKADTQRARPERKVEPKETPAAPPTPAVQVDPETPMGKAQQFLQKVTELMGVSVSVHVSTDEEGNVLARMEGDALGILIGRRGETLDALQYLTSLQVNKGKEGYTRVTLDSENYRAKREEALIRLANRMASRAVKTGRKVVLEAMNPYERRILHSALQGNDAVETHSEGEEPNRHVVITLKK